MKGRVTNYVPIIRIGLPRSIDNELARQCGDLGAPMLVSMGSLFDAKRQDFQRIGMAPWLMDAALDSAGFSAMLQGGYRWSVYDHVELVATNSARVWHGRDPGPCDLPFPWTWWAAMDYCCEQEIARDRSEVLERMRLTVATYQETLETVEEFWHEGFSDLPRPMPTLQGRTPADYLWSARALSDVWRRRPLTEAEEEDGRDESALPLLLGVGSICGREVHGPEGIMPVLEALHKSLPPHVRLHLFGVKGDVLPYLWQFDGRILSIDSMAWDSAARYDAGEIRKTDPGFSCSMAHRCRHMREWYKVQAAKARIQAPIQGRLF